MGYTKAISWLCNQKRQSERRGLARFLTKESYYTSVLLYYFLSKKEAVFAASQ